VARVFTREQFYELVWSKPMTHLAKDFAISEVALHKICRRHGIPNPPLSWWAKRAARKKVKQTPLPEAKAGTADRITIAGADLAKAWLNEVWIPAYNEVLGRPHGTLREALIVARMWNSSKGDALSALQAAGSEADPATRIEASLDRYGQCSATKLGRIPVMRRPGIVYDALKVT
jgi:hypothetical protein